MEVGQPAPASGHAKPALADCSPKPHSMTSALPYRFRLIGSCSVCMSNAAAARALGAPRHIFNPCVI